MKEKYSRRALLTALGVGAGMLPLLNNEAFAGAAPGSTLGPDGFPKRFICVVWTDGIYQKNWWQSGNDLTTGTLLPILAPLTPFRNKILIPHNVSIQNVFNSQNYGGHFCYPCILTGTENGTSASIDTLIAQSTPSLANAQLNLGCRTSNSHLSWKAGSIANSPNSSPKNVFNQLFAGANLSAAQISNVQARRKSILDLVMTQLTAFQGVVGTDDKSKIQSHLDAIRSIEDSLTSQTTAASCAPPSLGDAVDYTQTANYPALVAIQMKLAAAAVTCGMSRAVTLELIDDGGGNSLTFPWLNVSQANYHAIAHLGANAAADKTTIDTWFYQQVATNLLAPLDASVEGSGTALDNSCVLVANDMQEGDSHYVKKVPWLMAGSCGGFFKTGRVVELNDAPNNQLLTTILHAMGQTSVTSVGDMYPGDVDSLLT
ncbi:MAG TPA: DUF1552 domain-containing protein [Polyangiaceae bacterium]|jgi:hypothetical protein|nr:DUF1552 domain-containing protein [Polyangiaceae bacterium]